MKLAALRLHNVKRFAGRGVAIEGIGDGVNVLCAANEFGKSTSFEALHGLFFLPHSSTSGDVRNLRPYSGGNPLIEADLSVGDRRYRITKQFYGGRFAKVQDLGSGQLLAQADEAENFIAGLVHGGASGPAGLLWVRQGLTGLERRKTAEEESDRQARSSLLESVQGEVEAVTGGRRMADIMAAVAAERAALVTTTGKPKAGGRYFAAIDARDRLTSQEQRLADEVTALREELDRRTLAQRRLAELENEEERDARRQAIATAETAFEQARAQADRLKAAEAEFGLADERRDYALRDHTQYVEALEEARQLTHDSGEALRRREDAVYRRRTASEAIAQAQGEAEAAEEEAKAARSLLERLDVSAKAQDAAGKRAEQEDKLQKAEALRAELDMCETQLAQLRLPSGAVDELAALDIEIARIKAVHAAARPSVTVTYEGGSSASVTMAGIVLSDGEERGYDGHAQLLAPGIGTITLRTHGADQDDGRLAAAETQRQMLLAAMGIADLAAARAQQIRAQVIEGQAREARAQLLMLAPDGLDRLRETVAALVAIDPPPEELKADPDETRAARDVAEQRRSQAIQALRMSEPARDHANDAFVAAETALAKLQAQEQHIAAILGAADGREQRERDLATRLQTCATARLTAEQEVEALRSAAPDVDAAEAALRRMRSVEQATNTQIQTLRETLAGLNARIMARSDEAVEESWGETREALSAAQARVAAFEQEIAVLERLTQALDMARSDARDLYLTPVMNELRPLLGLLFDDVSITFDDRSLLPHKIQRSGLDEEVERLSGGMREQLSILTRLAFARLLARDGRSTPVILDDALVYSDDDRIERMFDALHRQARDQQIIVFSCRQRAFQRLGGHVLQMTEWQP